MESEITRELVCSVLWICISVNYEEPIALSEDLLGRYVRWLTIKAKETGVPIKRCHRCGHYYLPDVRTVGHQKYCYFGCKEWMRRINRRERNMRYRQGLRYKFTKSRQNQRYRWRYTGEDSPPPLELSLKHRPSITWIEERVVEVIHHLSPILSIAAIDWIHKVIKEEIEAHPFVRNLFP